MRRLGITGTYSSGKTFTSLVLSNYLGIQRTEARTMRELLPEAAPGKDLDEVTSAQLIQMIVARHVERVIHETRLSTSGFVSDGCSLQEWIYGRVRVKYGVNPNASAHLALDESVEKTNELSYFEGVMIELGKLFKRHVRASFDGFIHLRNELPLAKDGHRPVNEHFRNSSDELLLLTLNELNIPHHIVGGSIEQRCEQVADILSIKPVISLKEAIEKSSERYARMIM